MRVLVDITHPAHLYFFSNAVKRLRARDDEILLVGRDKDCLADLARGTGADLRLYGGAPTGVLGLAKTLASRQWWLRGVARQFQPDVMAAIGGTFIGFVGWAMKIPTVVFSDTESALLSNSITFPFATRICTPQAFLLRNRAKQVRYRGYHQSAYLHPSVFQPDPTVLDELGLAPGVSYSIVRFVGWAAGHDLGRSGLQVADKLRLVELLAHEGRVFVSSEGELPAAIERYRFKLPVHRMHHALAFASLLVGESSTMSAEAAVLGVPSVFIYPRVELGVTREQAERWKIVHWYTADEIETALESARAILRAGDRERWRQIGQKIAEDSVDVTEFICQQILLAAQSAE